MTPQETMSRRFGWLVTEFTQRVAGVAHAIVVSSHYRQAPESKFPAAHEDSYAAYRWTLENARELGGDAAIAAGSVDATAVQVDPSVCGF